MNTPKTVKVGDVVEIIALDLTKHNGEMDETEIIEPEMDVLIYGEVFVIQKKYIAVMFCKDLAKHINSNFDERLYIPIGCIKKIIILRRKGGENV